MPRNPRQQPSRRERGTGAISRDRSGWRAKITITVDGEPQVLRKRFAENEFTDAEQWLEDVIRENRGEHSLPASMQREYTVATWCRLWLTDHWDRLGVRTRDDYDQVLGTWVYPKIGDIPLANLGAHNIRAWKTWLAETPSQRYTMQDGRRVYQPLSTQRQLYAWRILHKALTSAVTQGIIQRHPMVGITSPNANSRAPRERVIPDTDMRLILGYLRETGCSHQSGHCALRWRLALNLGLRQGEALALNWNAVYMQGTDANPTPHIVVREHLQQYRWLHDCTPVGDGWQCGGEARDCPFRRDGGLVILPGTKIGTDDSRALALSASMVTAFEEHAGEEAREGLVFQTRVGTPIAPRNDARNWSRLLQTAGVAHHHRLHDARHSAATRVVAGTDLATASVILGHRSLQTTRGYVHPDASMTSRGLEALSDALERLEHS